ncbi:MAG: ATP-binding cassette domain-containing protein [Candidatus Electrothrix aestuarii]|uniref:ATP-binding cassette domain-containing protein n=1 Tax=Candidatus Electrothrix aestuarii TaxID=3062594 RepID=A0AAU8LWC9_9BACT|nr:ATP-binding cassette domain-containing protein [Candidatus Electrothrix aestuarii]
MTDFLRITGINKTFQPSKEVCVQALHDIHLNVEQGDLAVLSGPSGSGKTTLLNIIGGLDSPSSGEVTLDGQQITGLSQSELSLVRRDQIGFVFQAYNLIPVLTARENIEYVMKLQGKKQEECDQRTIEVAQKLGIDTLLNKLPSQMSGG